MQIESGALREKIPKIPRPTARRLSLYLREVQLRLAEGASRVSSRQLGESLGLADTQVRKDLHWCGRFGGSGVGYDAVALRDRLRAVMGLNQTWSAVLVGAGNIGRALLGYGRFEGEGFRIVGLFDKSKSLVGKRVAGTAVRPLSELRKVVEEHNARIGIIAVPREAAQEVGRLLVDAGVSGILNFAATRIDAGDVPVTSVDFTVALEQLAFEVTMSSAGEGSS
jgi:redox-sensing transcriptional repressor